MIGTRLVVTVGLALGSVGAGQHAAALDQGGTCKADWQKCSSNEQIANEYDGWNTARFECMVATGDAVKYGSPQWGGSELLKFTKYAKGDTYLKSGKAVLIDDEVKLQNAYGTYGRSRVFCVYDLGQKKVIGVSVDGG